MHYIEMMCIQCNMIKDLMSAKSYAFSKYLTYTI